MIIQTVLSNVSENVCNLYSPPDKKPVESDNEFLGRGYGKWSPELVAKVWHGVPSKAANPAIFN